MCTLLALCQLTETNLLLQISQQRQAELEQMVES